MSIVFSYATQTQWESLPLRHWVHTWEYGLIQKKNNRTVHHVIISDQEHTIGYMTLLTYSLWGAQSITYAPYGPTWTQPPTKDTLQATTTWLHTYGKQQNSIAVRCEFDTKHSGFFALLPRGYRTSFHQPRGEMILDLHDTWESLYSQFSKSTKRNIKKSQRNNVQVDCYHGAHMMDWYKDFIEINTANTHAHNTTTHTDSYFTSLFEILSTNPNNFVSIARQDNKVLAINIFTVFHNQAYCPFGASSEQGKKLSAYYALKAQSIKHLQEMGVHTFNWGGVAVGKYDENLKQLNQFKQGWGTYTTVHDDFYDLVISPWYWLYVLRSILK